MDSARYREQQRRFVQPKHYRADAAFPPPEKGANERTMAFSFTGEKGELELKLVHPIRNVVGLELTSLFMVNPYIAISNINACLVYQLVTAASGATPLATGTPTTHYMVLETGDFDPLELVEKLNAALVEKHDHHDFKFSYDEKETHKITLTNTHATDTFYIPKKITQDALLAATPLNNAVGPLWATLGFAVDQDDVEIRAADARDADVGQNANPPALPVNFSNNSDISFLIPDDDPANNYASLSGNFPPGLPMNVSGKSMMMSDQFLQFNNPFSMAKSKKCIYLVAKALDTAHEIVSCAGTIQSVRRRRTVASGTMVNGVRTTVPTNVEEKASAYAPVEGSVNIESVLAVIPIVSGQVDLVHFSTKSIDFGRSPIANFKNLRLQLISDDNRVVDMRGRSISATLTCKMMY